MPSKSFLRYSTGTERTYSPFSSSIESTFGSEAAARKEYARLRKLAERRLSRLREAGYSKSSTYRNYDNTFLPQKDIKTKTQLARALQRVSSFLIERPSTVAQQREQIERTIKTLEQRGVSGINQENFFSFGDFMQVFRQKKLNRLFDSDRVVELVKIVQSNGIDSHAVMQNLTRWLDQTEELEAAARERSDLLAKAHTSSDLQKIVNRIIEGRE